MGSGSSKKDEPVTASPAQPTSPPSANPTPAAPVESSVAKAEVNTKKKKKPKIPKFDKNPRPADSSEMT
jgi:hypothetical protein